MILTGCLRSIPMSKFKRLVHDFMRRPRHYIRWAMIHIALIFFFADLLAAIWPSFNIVWGGTARLGVALAAFCATAAEFFHEEAHEHFKPPELHPVNDPDEPPAT